MHVDKLCIYIYSFSLDRLCICIYGFSLSQCVMGPLVRVQISFKKPPSVLPKFLLFG